ncbi:hypothetical protein F4805DRAFT_386686 [Annulohypoxylon moriforme]|nr:hypothetical protein F4805DRAFT_386686 [Annulohypoxylon moriforme]
MGTRNLICIRVNKQWVVAKYCQWDGYPTGQGVILFNFLHVEGNLARLRAGLDYIYETTKEDREKIQEVAEAEVARLKALDRQGLYNYLAPLMSKFPLAKKPEDLEDYQIEHYFFDADRQNELLFPSLSRSTGGNILQLIANATAEHKLPIMSELEFAADWFSCEWAYIVDLDDEQLKVFGYREPNHEGHPFEKVVEVGDDVPKFVASFTFSELRSLGRRQFIARAKDIEREAQDTMEEHIVGEGDSSWDDYTEDDDADEEDANGHNVNGDSADAVASRID